MPTKQRKRKSPDSKATPAKNPNTIDELIKRIASDDDEVRTAAWLSAGDIGAPAVEPLAGLMTDTSMEIGRAAKRGLGRIVRHCGRPGADAERQAVSSELVGLLDKQPAGVRREMLWMLSEIGGDDCVGSIASLLTDSELREDARMALERIPGDASLDALKTAFDGAPADFKPNFAESLRCRGAEVADAPSTKLTPVKPTEVKSL